MPESAIESTPKHPGNHLPFDQKSVKTRKAAIIDLKEQNYSSKEIAAITGYTPASIDTIYCNIKDKRNDFDKLRPKALKAIKKIVQGKAVGDAKAPLTSDVLRAGDMILDRTDPIISKSESLSISMNLGPEEIGVIDSLLSKHYQPKISEQPVDKSDNSSLERNNAVIITSTKDQVIDIISKS